MMPTTTQAETSKAVDARKVSASSTRYPSTARFDKLYGGILIRARRVRDDLTQRVLAGHYELGKLVMELDELTHQSVHGRSPMEMLAGDLGVNARTLYLCARLARAVPEDEFQRLIKPPVCWDHIRTLINQGQLDRLEHWVERITQEQLSAKDVEFELREGMRSQRDGSGRRPMVPKNLKSGLNQLHASCNKFLRRLNLSLFGDEFDLVDELRNTPPDELAEDMQTTYAQAAGRLEAIATNATEQAKRMRESIEWFNEVFERRHQDESSETQTDAQT